MKLVDLNQTIFVPVVDETKGGMTVEMKMTVEEFFRKFCQGFEPNVVDVVPVVHGRWIKRKTWNNAVCSYCSFENANMTKYCPACGAKMDGERRESE